MMKKLLLLLALPFMLATADAQENDKVKPNYALAEQFSPKKILRMVKQTRVLPIWFEDCKQFIYSWSDTNSKKFYIVDAVKGTKRELWDMDWIAKEITMRTGDPYDALHTPININRIIRDGRFVRFDVASNKEVPRELPRHERNDSTKIKENKGKKMKKTFYFEYDIKTGELLERTKDEIDDLYPNYPGWANVSPDGKFAIYEKNYNLWYMSMEDLEKLRIWDKDTTVVEHQLTTGGRPNRCYAYHSLDEKPDSTKRYRVYALWSPDSRHFVMTHRADSILSKMWVINSLSNPRPTLETYRYQMPGEETPVTTMELFDFENKTSRMIDVSKFKQQRIGLFSKPGTHATRYENPRKSIWLGDNNGFYFERISRDMKKIEVCYVSLDCDTAKMLVHEEMNTSIESKQIRLVNGGKQFIQWSERTGWAMLYLYNADGTLKNAITNGAYHVEDVVAVNEDEKKIYFTACGYNKDENPYYMHLYSVNFDGSGLKQIDETDMNISGYSVAENGEAFVVTASRVDTTPVNYVYSKRGKKSVELGTADLSQLFAAGYKFPERFTVKAADGITDLHGVMYKPFDFDSTKRYPLIEYVYPGPQTEAVNESWSSGMNRVDRLAQMGFIVITVGNRGGHPNRSKWYHNFGYGNLRDYGLADKKAAAQQLIARHKFIDGENIGIHGHSGGGFMSTAAILTYNDFFKAAVSCAGNHDNRIYNNWWSEKHHGIKENIKEKTNKEGVIECDTTFSYNISTNQELAGRLKGHLLLVTGDMDNNVHPANTTRVVDALIRANKRFEMLILPGDRHGFETKDEYFFWKMADFFSKHLLGEAKESEVDIKEMNNDK
ncbi:MAG: prolyl oligopeptidase family serine peptidase [Bacteroidales bacterium]|nr:prolyl oligopeptidase family serine peptidase [Bacteroidales bacterium]